ncbi:MAG: hypothetical protein WHU94_12390 [Thermogemmata sp.]|jgi:hypothetical protein|uniref:Uncharacterized protein n=1 Tax=Thermogemmata fonticola TaxID=2755323 RepID=A0A7V8VCP0_9BACT|nr:hypothetical protein [Thermogemmata fonticola]MBA2225643.1 hypothetical protein [Thermogemmata fonticola]
MRRLMIAVLVAGGLAASWTTWANPPTEEAKSPHTLDKRVAALEKRVTELEQRVAELEVQSKVSSSSAIAVKLIGNWAARDDKLGVVGLRFMDDGMCRVATVDRENRVDFAWGTYEVVGKAVMLILKDDYDPKGKGPYRTSFLIESIDDKNLTILGQLPNKGITFERQ